MALVEDLCHAAELFAPVHKRTGRVDGYVSLLAYDTAQTVAEASALYKKAKCPNLFIRIPGTKEGGPAIEEAILSGVSVNVTLLFSREHYLAAAAAY
jgi:transaldolase